MEMMNNSWILNSTTMWILNNKTNSNKANGSTIRDTLSQTKNKSTKDYRTIS